MATAFYAETDIRNIFVSLPEEEKEHMRRVGSLVGIIIQKFYRPGIRLKCPDEYKYFKQAALYHDIGKAWVPKSILTKPGRLTKAESVIMCEHPVFAQKLFKGTFGPPTGIPEHLIKLTADSAVYHHEWWNGSGYPFGISYQKIPLIARITSICDAYDAITSDRIYRKAHTHYYACRELKENSGSQFDPELVQVFLDNEAEFLILNRMISCL